jgi:5-methyltetrahydropteroyltriglutamate--homocysteine methyltransferase
VKRSESRILTTHVGSLVKPADLQDLFSAQQSGQTVDEAAMRSRIGSAIKDVVHKQAEIGIDIVNDGELSKSSWAAYFADRLSNVEVRDSGPPRTPIFAREEPDFPDWFEGARSGGGPAASSYVLRAATATRGRPQPVIQSSYCVGEVKYIGQELVQRDIDNLKAAGQGTKVEELCMTALAPPIMSYFLRNEHYKDERDFVLALAEAMNEEYRAITEAGILLQLDEPAIATHWQIYPTWSVEDFRAWLEVQVEALNLSLKGIPEDRVRMHTCWGSVHHPHRADIPLEDIVDLILQVNVGAYSLEASNPRHDHDWQVWKNLKLAEGKSLIPGVIGHFTDFIEHPQLVKERIVKYANVIGKENVIAGVDCGLGTRVGSESVLWAKFESLVEGARLASEELWG